MDMQDQLAKERRARMAAERLLELKQKELRDANRKLSLHALSLSDTLVAQQEKAQQVETELEFATSRFEIAERRLWDSIETFEDGFAVFDSEGVMIAVNSAYQLPFDGLTEVKPGVTYRRLLQLAVEEGVVNIGSYTRQDWVDQMLWRLGQERLTPLVLQLWDGTSIKMIDQRSRDGDIVSLALNITDTIRNEAKLKEARYRAEAANRAKSAFLANMTHELRTPMNGVVAMADLLAESALDDEQRLYVDTIRSSGDALLGLINDVLDYSKIEAEKLTIQPAEFDLEKTIHDVATMLQTTARQKGLDLLIDYDLFSPREFVGDGGRLRQVLTNLVGNAIKFTNEGHILIRAVGLPVADEPGKQKVHVTVEDTGIGIPAEKLDAIFGEFNQVEDERNRRYDGTGLGLSISKRLIGLMDGEIWVDSEFGIGSSFGFSLPLPVVEHQTGVDDEVPPWLERVIVADMKSRQREILAKQLVARGLRVLNAANVDEIKAYAPGPNDVILLASNVIDDFSLDAVRQLGCDGEMILLCGSPLTLPKTQDIVAGQINLPVRRSALLAALRAIEHAPKQPTPRAPEAAPTSKAVERVSEPAPDSPAPPKVAPEAPPQAPQVAPADPAPPPQAEVPLAAPAAPPQQPREAPRRMKILAADDNKTNRLVFSKLVKTLDIDLTFATNGIEAVAAFQETSPDLVFMDISMPEMDGKDATREIRALEARDQLGHTTIVALTAHSMDGDDQGILAAGLDHYLTKPLKKDAIFARIAKDMPQGCLPVFPETAEVA